ncbi:MAG: Ldh family oxidoreductase [Candidatus Dormibacteraceae bacterium]
MLEQGVLVERESMLDFAHRVFKSFGATDENAAIVARHLVESSRMGLNSHGVMRIPQYVADIDAGHLVPNASPVVVSDSGTRIALDGRHTFGQVVGVAMAEKALAAAKKNGIAFVTAANMGHAGRLGAYVEQIAAGGMFGLAGAGTSRSAEGNWVAPFGGKEGRLSTNPLAYAFPVNGGDPIVVDLATSTTAEGVVRWLKKNGRQAPPGTLRDSEGRPSTDPQVLYDHPRGTIEPIGGPHYGHKGTAIGLLPAILALIGADEPTWTTQSGGMSTLAVRTGPRFAEETEWMAEYIRSSPPIDAERPVLMPGDRERAVAKASRGIEVDPDTWESLSAIAGRARTPLPSRVGV